MRLRTEPWLLDDAPRALATILELGGTTPGQTHVAYVSPDAEKVCGVVTFATPSPHGPEAVFDNDDARWALSARLHDIAQELVPRRTFEPGEGWSRMRGALFTVVCREGRVVSTAEEMQFHLSWRYSNHGTEAIDGDVLVVTPHGWTSTLTEQCGREPALPQV